MKKNGCSQSQLGVTDDCVVDLPHKCRNALFDALIMIRDSSLKVWKQTTGKQSINLSSCWRRDGGGRAVAPLNWAWRSELKENEKL